MFKVTNLSEFQEQVKKLFVTTNYTVLVHDEGDRTRIEVRKINNALYVPEIKVLQFGAIPTCEIVYPESIRYTTDDAFKLGLNMLKAVELAEQLEQLCWHYGNLYHTE